MKVSIIIPIYKVEKYLRRCVNSILEQTYRNIEVILVNDGSPDGCPAICNDYIRKDCRVKVIHKKNGGLSDARNVGTNAATGEFIMYVDSDDFWCGSDCLQKLAEEVRRTPECDFIGFNCSYYYPSSDSYKAWIPYNDRLLSGTNVEDTIISLVRSGTFSMSACMKIIRRSFLVDNNISFCVGIYSEDIPWFIDILLAAKYVRFINIYMYAYRKENVNSISSSFSEKSFSDRLNMLPKEIQKINEAQLSDTCKAALFSFWAYEYCILSGELQFFGRQQRRYYTQALQVFDYLMAYRQNPKVSKVSFVRDCIGWSLTKRLMHFYITKFLR